jgi:hypothetical protein
LVEFEIFQKVLFKKLQTGLGINQDKPPVSRNAVDSG